jgi:hypothetical protein
MMPASPHRIRILFATAALCAGMLVQLAAEQDQETAVPPPLAEARQAYDATNYERARELLDGVIAGFASTPSQPESRQLLAAAYELRARTRVNLKDADGARTDFRALLLLDPAYQPSSQVGPRVLALFGEVRKTTIGQVDIFVTPADAQVTLDGAAVGAEAIGVPLVGGTHSIAATRPGHTSAAQTFTVVPGAPPQRIALALERVASTVALSTSPANVEVLVDGVSRGMTEPDPEASASAGGPVSKRFLIADLQNGRHRIEFRRDCFIGAEQEVDVPRPSDYRLDLVKLAPAVATVSVSTNAPGTTVFIDDAPRGPAPLVMNDVCQGPHVVEVRSRFGRYVKRMELRPGQKEVVQAIVRPALAIVSDSGANEGVRGGPDLRLAAEVAFQDTKTITLYAPAAKMAADLHAADQLPVDWLAFDPIKRAIGGAAKIGEPARRKIGEAMAKALDAQGIAAIARDPAGDRSDMLLTLLAPGSAEPDVIRWRLDNPQSARAAATRLDDMPPLFKASLGLLAVDVADVPGAIVATVEPGGSAEAAGIRPGDVIVAAGDTQVTSGSQLLGILSAHQGTQPLSVEVRDRAGAAKKVSVAVQAVPSVVALMDQSLLFNKLAIDYVYRVAALTTPLEETAVRLNLAVVLMRLGSWADAARELERVVKVAGEGRIPATLTDSIGGTAHYLLGMCAEATGDVAGATRAWKTAAQSRGNLLTDSGEPLKELSERRLNQLRTTRTGTGG